MQTTALKDCRKVKLTSDQFDIDIFIYFSNVDNWTSLLGVAKGAERLLRAAGSWAHCGYHGRLGIATKTFL